MAEQEVAADAAGGVRVGYAGRQGLVGLLSRNFFLTLVTIGIYRFWAATRLRRYLWSNIDIAGDGLEYTGTGREFFLGFLIALAILAPLSIAYAISYRLALGNQGLAATLQGFYFLALFVFLQVALFRSRRYRLSRTAWRGIYAGQTGSTWHYLGLYLGYGLLTVVTLGLALPWAQVALERYKLNHTWFGDRALRLDAAGRDLWWRWLVVLVIGWGAIALAILPNLAALLHPAYLPGPPGKPPIRLMPHPGAFAYLFVAIAGGGLALIWYRIEAFRYLASRVTLGEMRLHSTAKGSKAVGQVLLFGLGMFGVLMGIGLLLVAIGTAALPIVRTMVIEKTVTQQNGVVLVFAVMAPIYILIFYLWSIISYCWLWIPIIRHLASTLEIHNFAVAQTIAQSTQPRQKLGIADSFELGAF